MTTLRRCITLAFGGIVAGCTSQKFPECYPAHGQVIRNGKAVANASLVLHPADAATYFQAPIAHSDVNGQFIVTTFRQRDRAPAGEYRVTVELRGLRQVGEEQVRDGPNELPPQYATPASTPLRIQIQPGENDLGRLELK